MACLIWLGIMGRSLIQENHGRIMWISRPFGGTNDQIETNHRFFCEFESFINRDFASRYANLKNSNGGENEPIDEYRN